MEKIINITGIKTVRNVFCTVHAEPVSACEPYLIAV